MHVPLCPCCFDMPLTFNPLRKIRIATGRDLWIYTVRTTSFCISVALALDIIQQLVFFQDWPSAFRSWVITVLVVVVVAAPATRAIGKAHLTLFQASQTDPLTGLLNRRALLEGVEDRSTLMALLIVDIDHFKSVNDRHGHLVGDHVIRAVADIMQRELGAIGRIGRLGGEEFALISNDCDEDGLLRQLEIFRETIARTAVHVGSTIVSITISAGVATRRPNQSFQALYVEADQALYRAKTAGRNRIVVAPPQTFPFQAGTSLPLTSAS
ncbi:GGDEF domain-containing protein [Methylobacterium frigidaeris]|uniref:GGDEF domain-containing protein n=2 Tax=Methylobacterium frigidaeris TaxID=2038277 RepID=UPI001EDCE7A3|nr:GGDEF domain-containing protein [Methylobacterium frigidaeris]